MINNLNNEYVYSVRLSPRIPFSKEEEKEAKRLLTWYQMQNITFWLLKNHSLYIQFPYARKDTDPVLVERANRDGILIRRLLIMQRHIIEEFSCTDEQTT